MGSKDAKAGKPTQSVFKTFSLGVSTNRDVWVYNTSKNTLEKNMNIHINYANEQKDPLNPITNTKKAKFTRGLKTKLKKQKPPFNKSKIRVVLYRPFFKQWLYFDDSRFYNEDVHLLPKFFPKNDSENLAIAVPYHVDVKFSAIVTDTTPDIQLNKNGQVFPLKTKNNNGGGVPTPVHRNLCIIIPYKSTEFSVLITDQYLHDRSQPMLPTHGDSRGGVPVGNHRPIQDTGRVLSVHNRHDTGLGSNPSRAGIPDEGDDEMMVDNITDYALDEYQTHYNDKTITKQDIFYYTYGILHHPGYRKKYANNLTRELPHIPMAPDFWAFSKIGKQLADLHLSYETCKRYDLGPPMAEFGKYLKMDFATKKVNGKRVKDPTTLRINGTVIFENIPETHYKVNGRTPLEWAIDRYKIHTDKDSGIVNDATNVDIIPLIERLVYVGIESDRLVSALPEKFEPKVLGAKKVWNGPIHRRPVSEQNMMTVIFHICSKTTTQTYHTSSNRHLITQPVSYRIETLSSPPPLSSYQATYISNLSGNEEELEY